MTETNKSWKKCKYKFKTNYMDLTYAKFGESKWKLLGNIKTYFDKFAKNSYIAYKIINNKFIDIFKGSRTFCITFFYQKLCKRRSCSPNFQKIVKKPWLIHNFCHVNANFSAISNLASISLIGRFHIADREFSNGIPAFFGLFQIL